MRNLFELRTVHGDKGATYAASHELHNEVLITLPSGYFDLRDKARPWPPFIDVSDFNVKPKYEPPVNEVRAELQSRMPNLTFSIEFGGYLSVQMPESRGSIWMGGDSDGWRFQAIDSHGDEMTRVEFDELGLDPDEQDVNLIATTLIYGLSKTPWATEMFTFTKA